MSKTKADPYQWIKFRRESFATYEDWKSLCEIANADPHDGSIESITLHIASADIDCYD